MQDRIGEIQEVIPVLPGQVVRTGAAMVTEASVNQGLTDRWRVRGEATSTLSPSNRQPDLGNNTWRFYSPECVNTSSRCIPFRRDW